MKAINCTHWWLKPKIGHSVNQYSYFYTEGDIGICKLTDKPCIRLNCDKILKDNPEPQSKHEVISEPKQEQELTDTSPVISAFIDGLKAAMSESVSKSKKKTINRKELKDMNVIFRGRQQGKTTDIIKRAAEVDGQIITNTVPQIDLVQKRADELGVSIRKPVSIRQFALLVGDITKNKIPVIVDDAEYCLQYLLNTSMAGSRVLVDTISINDDTNGGSKGEDGDK